jgi:hypothetical protein
MVVFSQKTRWSVSSRSIGLQSFLHATLHRRPRIIAAEEAFTNRFVRRVVKFQVKCRWLGLLTS